MDKSVSGALKAVEMGVLDRVDDETKEKLIEGELSISQVSKKLNTHVGQNSGENEWYTPEKYIDAARNVMGSIDLDPASCETANEIVGAESIYTKENSGLDKPWIGNVWMNPPYAQPLISHFSEKICKEWVAGNIESAIVLVNNATETKWFQLIASESFAICFPSGRVKFWHPERVSAPLQGQAILYIGHEKEKFEREFSKFGFVVSK